MFGALRRDAGGEVTYLVDEGGELFNAVTFIIFGAVILGPAARRRDLAGRRSTRCSASPSCGSCRSRWRMLGTGARRPTVAFLGWFGPRGLASIVFAVILLDDADLPHLQTLLLAITVTIAALGLRARHHRRPLTERYVRWWRSHPQRRAPPMESVPAAEHRVRRPVAGPAADGLQP